jgi:hypothetical protein
MDFSCKARWVLDGHKIHNPIGSTHAAAASRDGVRIAFTCAALNSLDVFAAGIRNAYLQASSSQKDCILCGPEFQIENVGKVALIRQALYGGKSTALGKKAPRIAPNNAGSHPVIWHIPKKVWRAHCCQTAQRIKSFF